RNSLGEDVPGVSVHAQAIEQILGQTFLTRPDWAYGIELLATFLFSFLLAVLALAFGLKFALLIGAPVVALMVGGSWVAFTRFGLLLDPIYPALAALCVGLSVEAMLSPRSIGGPAGRFWLGTIT